MKKFITIMILGSIVGIVSVSSASPIQLGIGYCDGLEPMCMQGSPVCVCSMTTMQCYWSCR